MPLGAGLFTGAAYLVGSVPGAYIVARLLRGIDIRGYGSGSVSGTNVWHTVSHRASIPVFLIDIAKGVLPVLLAKRLGLDLPWQVAAGLASIAGHNWSLFLRFQGGRGLVTAGGVALVIAPVELLVAGIVISAGFLAFRSFPLAVLLGVVALALASLALGEPPAVTWGCLGILFLVILKRFLGNRSPAASSRDKWVPVYRLLFDRDIRDRRAWIDRRPPAHDDGAGH
ncbi:MAG: glycerol-3-phosphate acyltransferase [Dehalococcoidia bacterium]